MGLESAVMVSHPPGTLNTYIHVLVLCRYMYMCVYHFTIHALIRFLLCNQAMFPSPVVSYRQHSSTSQSSAVPMEEGDSAEPTDGDGVEPQTNGGSEEKAKLSKVLSTEDEVARLTIEVRFLL